MVLKCGVVGQAYPGALFEKMPFGANVEMFNFVMIRKL